MRRREFIALLGSATSLCTRRSFAQPTDRVRLVGWLSGAAPNDPLSQTVRTVVTDELRHLGWVEGQNLRIERRWTSGDPDRGRTFAKELVELQPDVIMAGTALSLLRHSCAKPIAFLSCSLALAFPLSRALSRIW